MDFGMFIIGSIVSGVVSVVIGTLVYLLNKEGDYTTQINTEHIIGYTILSIVASAITSWLITAIYCTIAITYVLYIKVLKTKLIKKEK